MSEFFSPEQTRDYLKRQERKVERRKLKLKEEGFKVIDITDIGRRRPVWEVNGFEFKADTEGFYDEEGNLKHGLNEFIEMVKRNND